MNVRCSFVSLAALVAVVSFWATRADGQRTTRVDIRVISSNVILPQSRSFTAEGRSPIEVTDVKVGVG